MLVIRKSVILPIRSLLDTADRCCCSILPTRPLFDTADPTAARYCRPDRCSILPTRPLFDTADPTAARYCRPDRCSTAQALINRLMTWPWTDSEATACFLPVFCQAAGACNPAALLCSPATSPDPPRPLGRHLLRACLRHLLRACRHPLLLLLLHLLLPLEPTSYALRCRPLHAGHTHEPVCKGRFTHKHNPPPHPPTVTHPPNTHTKHSVSFH